MTHIKVVCAFMATIIVAICGHSLTATPDSQTSPSTSDTRALPLTFSYQGERIELVEAEALEML